MPKKRYQGKFSKPPSTAPSSIQPRSCNRGAQGSYSGDKDQPKRSVNALLDSLRRQDSSGPTSSAAADLLAVTPSVPPELRSALGLHSVTQQQSRHHYHPLALRTAASVAVAATGTRQQQLERHDLRHALPQLLDANGRPRTRIRPAGPAPPASWLRAEERRLLRERSTTGTQLPGRGVVADGDGPVPGTSPHEADDDAERGLKHLLSPCGPLEGRRVPEPGSLVDLVLGLMAETWGFQREYNAAYLSDLPSQLREALVRRVALTSGAQGGLTVDDLAILLRPPQEEGDEMGKDDNDDSAVQPSPADEANVNLTTLDLSCAIGTTLTVRQVERLLFPSRRNRVDEEPPQSWDVPAPMRPSFALLPNLTRLSLAVRPGSRAPVSWTQLLHLSSRLKGLTQLSLAYWPRPSCAAVADYEDPSHLESWDDAVAIVNRLSSYTYMLELLDLTGCHSWAFTLLLAREMDWAKNWGRLEKVKVYPNRPSSGKSNKTLEDDLRRSLETHVRFVRKGRRGPWCTFTVV